MFYFAWVDPTETTFSSSTHAREDEEVFAISLQQTEGEFPALDLDLLNPRIGLLAPSRKQWAWLSYRKKDDTVVPLFFGRLIGVPQDIEQSVVRLSFVCRPVDYEETQATLAATLEVSPYFDAIWAGANPTVDAALNGRPALWHVDRVTQAVTISDIITGEDGTLFNEDTSVPYDSVAVTYSTSPARKVIVDASVTWTQSGQGDLDISQKLLKAFTNEGTTGLTLVNGSAVSGAGTINVIAGDDLVSNWPAFGDSIGGGWTVGASFAQVVGDPPLPPTIIGNGITAYPYIQSWAEGRNAAALRFIFDRSPGFVVSANSPLNPSFEGVNLGPGSVDIFNHDVYLLWVPIWRIAAGMSLHWEAARARTETLHFEVTADVQPLLTDPGADEIVNLTFGPAAVDDVIPDKRLAAYFSTGRGNQSVLALVAEARATLLARARAIQVDFSVPFEDGLGLSCRKNAVVFDPRLPSGVAAGKVKGYTLAADGSSGALIATVSIGCTIGRDGHVEAVRGTPAYAADGYVEDGYQDLVGAVSIPFAGDLGFSMSYSPAGNDVHLTSIGYDYLSSLDVTGTLDVQKAAATEGALSSTPELADKVNAFKTTATITMRPVQGGPFTTAVVPTITDLKVPRTIDLEEAAT